MQPYHALRALVGLGAVVLLVGTVSGASAHRSDIWHATQAIAERDVKERFANVQTARCEPDRSSSTFVQQKDRLWNRFGCTGQTFDGVEFSLSYTATGECKPCWRMTGLQGAEISDLRQRAAKAAKQASPPPPPLPPPPPPPPPSPPSASAQGSALAAEPFSQCGVSYRRAGQRVRYAEGLDGGQFLLLRDGSFWQTSPALRAKTEPWNRFHTVVLIDGQFGFPCTMVNLNLGERIPVQPARAGSCTGAGTASTGQAVEYRSRRNGGELVALTDGSEWEVSEPDRPLTARWRRRSHEVVVFQGDGRWPYICALINLDRGELIDVRPAA
jgi:hypothetical protein